MLNVAVCDHDLKVSDMIEDMLIEIAGFHNIEVTCFYSGEDLLHSAMQENFYDLMFIGIELVGLNGIDIGRELRKKWLSDETLLIFTAESRKHILETFDSRPFHIITKPIDKNNLIKILKKALKKIGENNRVFQFQKGRGKFIRYPLDSILWFEVDEAHYVTIILKHKIDRLRGKMNDVEKALNEMDAKNFVRLHKSYLVNMDYIEKYDMQFIQMRIHGVIIQISEKYKEPARNVLMKYLGEEI